MKYRLVELKDKEGDICYRIQKRNLFHIWRYVRTTKIIKEYPKWITLSKDIRNFYSKERAIEIIEQLKTKYTEYRGCRIYSTIDPNVFYTKEYGKVRFYSDDTIYYDLIYGSYQECCDAIDKRIESSSYKQIIEI